MTATTTAAPAPPTPAAASQRSLRVSDMAERLLWTFVAPARTAESRAVTDRCSPAAWASGGLTSADRKAARSAAVNFLTVVARWRLSVLPDPGEAFRR